MQVLATRPFCRLTLGCVECLKVGVLQGCEWADRIAIRRTGPRSYCHIAPVHHVLNKRYHRLEKYVNNYIRFVYNRLQASIPLFSACA